MGNTRNNNEQGTLSCSWPRGIYVFPLACVCVALNTLRFECGLRLPAVHVQNGVRVTDDSFYCGALQLVDGSLIPRIPSPAAQEF